MNRKQEVNETLKRRIIKSIEDDKNEEKRQEFLVTRSIVCLSLIILTVIWINTMNYNWFYFSGGAMFSFTIMIILISITDYIERYYESQ